MQIAAAAPNMTVISVEVIRVSRYHDGRSNWGDQMVPTIREAKKDERESDQRAG